MPEREAQPPRSELALPETRVLSGRKALVTRPASPDDALAGALRDAGAEVCHLPLVEILPILASDALDRVLREAAHFQAWFFTSRNAVAHTTAHLARLGSDPGRFSAPVLCVGAATAEAARRAGFPNAGVPEGARNAETLARNWLQESDRRGCRAFFPRAEGARRELPVLLRAAGVDLQEAVVYRSVSRVPSAAALEAAATVDVVTFASSSAARAFVDVGADVGRAVIGALGSRTAETLADLGIPAQVVAERPEPRVLVDSLARFLEEREAR